MLKDFRECIFDVLIQGGQSNAEGYGYGPVKEPFVPNEKIWYYDQEHFIMPALELVCGNDIRGDFSLSFATEYIKAGLLSEGRKLLIIRAAVGGTGFCDNRWGLSDDLFTNMMRMIKTALALNAQNRLCAFLWHQGETDAVGMTPSEIHKQNLYKLVSAVRETYDCQNLPFIAGDFVHQWMNWVFHSTTPVTDAIREVCHTVGYAGFVETDGLLSNNQQIGIDDPIHFSREALYELGIRYFKAYEAILRRRKH